MAGFIAEFFGYRAEDTSEKALTAAEQHMCPAIKALYSKPFARNSEPSGACAIRQVSANSPDIICCPKRLYADDHELLKVIARKAFGCDLPLCSSTKAVEEARSKNGAIAVFGQGWGGELRLPQRNGSGSYSVDWILAKLNSRGMLEELTAAEVQTVDTTGNYRDSRSALLENRSMAKSSVGVNWENVSKRILPQIIYKGQVLQRETLCKTGLYFVCPQPVYERILERLGGKNNLPEFPSGQPGTIHFFCYDYDPLEPIADGKMRPLTLIEEYCTAVHKIQEAFPSITLPETNVYRNAIEKALGREPRQNLPSMKVLLGRQTPQCVVICCRVAATDVAVQRTPACPSGIYQLRSS